MPTRGRISANSKEFVESDLCKLIRERIGEVISTTKRDSVHEHLAFCYKIYRMILDAGKTEQVHLFRYVCDNFSGSESGAKFDPEPIDTEQLRLIDRLDWGVIRKVLETGFFEKDYTVDELYIRLWEFVNNPVPILELNKYTSGAAEQYVKAVVFLLVLNSNYIPYFCLGDKLTMEGGQFGEYLDRMGLELRMINFVLRSNVYLQNTEQASHLMKVIESRDDISEKSVLLALVLAHYQSKLSKLEKKEKDSEDEE